MKKTDFDVIIVGGGPAGAVSAIYLSRSGLRTALIERKEYPRETLCGEFLSHEVIQQLRNLKLDERFVALNPNKIRSFSFVTGERIFTADLPFSAYSIPRSIFDEFLMREAVNSGTHLFQPADAKEVIRHGNNFVVRIFSKENSDELTSRFVIGAFGKSNIEGKLFGGSHRRKTTGYYGIKFHINKDELTGLDESRIYLFGGNNIYAGVNYAGRGAVTVCFLIRNNNKDISSSDGLGLLFAENRRLSEMFNDHPPDLKKLEVYGAGNIYFGRKDIVKNGVIMVGDAARIIAPLAGDGIGMAFQSAHLASDIITEASGKNISIDNINKIYRIKWNRLFYRRVLSAHLVQNIVLRSSYMSIIPESIINLSIPIIINATRE